MESEKRAALRTKFESWAVREGFPIEREGAYDEERGLEPVYLEPTHAAWCAYQFAHEEIDLIPSQEQEDLSFDQTRAGAGDAVQFFHGRMDGVGPQYWKDVKYFGSDSLERGLVIQDLKTGEFTVTGPSALRMKPKMSDLSVELFADGVARWYYPGQRPRQDEARGVIHLAKVRAAV
jgi:hypothetical protein